MIGSQTQSVPTVSRKYDKSPNTQRKLEQPLRTNPMSRSPLSAGAGAVEGEAEEQKPQVDFEQRNLQRLEAGKAKKAAEIKEMED
jgi:hypothetical protein